MNEKFSGTKWEADKYFYDIFEAGTDKFICTLAFNGTVEDVANSRLIVASPEMYFMLYEMWHEFSHGMFRDEKYMHECINAISKVLLRINPDVFKPNKTLQGETSNTEMNDIISPLDIGNDNHGLARVLYWLSSAIELAEKNNSGLRLFAKASQEVQS